MSSDYEARVERRRARLEARANRLRAEGESRIARSSEMAQAIPFGQPILVGHHSEGRDRRYRERIRSGFDKGFQTLKAAGEAQARAASVGTGGVSSDDPEAVTKLRGQVAELEALQERMKNANGIIRRHKGEAAIPHLVQAGFSQKVAERMIVPDDLGRRGFADYQLTNNGANIRRIKARIEDLGRQAQRVTKSTERTDGLQVVENAEENRLQLIFPGKPDVATRAVLKAHGFRWAPSVGAWQRQLGNGARWAADCVLAAIDKGAA